MMRSIKFSFYYLLLLLTTGTYFHTYSQSINADIGRVSISSPNAASLGKFGDIPVGIHTGIPDINIPIYTIKSGPLSLPINVDYHASGLKVQEQASWVGAGWALNAGGVITRTVIGAPDDKGLYGLNTNKGHYSDYGYNSYLFSPGPASCSASPYVCASGRTGMPVNGNAPQDGYIQTGILDGEPDLFFFNFGGYSGKFYFNDDRTPMIVPEQDLKIVPIYTGSDWRGFTGFIITTPDGTQYYFGKNPLPDGNPDAIDITYNASTQNPYNGQGASSSWYLNRIVSADNMFSISLIYVLENYSTYSYSMHPIPGVRNPNFISYNLEYDLNKNFINGVRLSKIVFANGEVDFNAGGLRQDLSMGATLTDLVDHPNTDGNAGARSLGSIDIKSNIFCKQFTFYTSYFYDNSPLTGELLTTDYPGFNITSDEYRLRLDSIKESSCDSSLSIPPYKFSYFTGTVPRKLSFGIDHWGFYNGVTNNSGLIPTYQILPTTGQAAQMTTVSGADRDTHWPGSLGGALQQIVYPTGGATSFEFESNDVYTSTTSYYNATLTNLVIEQFGQAETSNSGNITSNGNAIAINITNNSTYTATLSISNSSGVVYTTPIANNSTFQPTVSLAAGTYTVTLSVPPYYTPPGGVQAILTQYQSGTTIGSQAVGGLRIKTVTSTDAVTSNNLVTSYRYTYNNVANGQSSGILFSRPIYVEGIRSDVWATVNGASCSSTGCLTCFGSDVSYYQSPSSIRPMATTQGNHIGYGEVYVSQTGNGYTEYRYYSSNGSLPNIYDAPIQDVCVRSLSTLCDPGLPNSPAPPDPYDPMRGDLAFIGYYNQGGQLLKSKNYVPSYQFNPMTTPGIVGRFFVTGYVSPPFTYGTLNPDPFVMEPSNNEVPAGILTFTEYSLQTAKKISDQVTTTTYDPVNGTPLVETNITSYGSSYHHEPTQMINHSSKGEILQTNYSYAFDFRISNFNVADQLSTYTANINSDNAYLSSALAGVTLSPSDPNYYYQRLNIFTNYRYMKAIDRQTYIAYRTQNFTADNNVYAADHAAAKAAADAQLQPILQLQDEFINTPIEISLFRGSNLTKAVFTNYGSVANPAVYVYPVKDQFIHLSSPGTSFTAATVSGNTLTKDSRYTDEDKTNFSLGNVIESTPKTGGYTTAYLWDYINTKPIAKVANALASQIAYTSFEGDGTGNWTVSSPLRDFNTPALTGTASYSLGNGTISYAALNSSTTYTISYWSTGSSYAVTGTSSVKQGRSVTINEVQWTYYEHTVSGVTSLNVSGGGNIDELRLYPASAFMTTYTYNPLLGITTECDVANRITYYQYDALGRLNQVLDQDRNILKQTDYQYQHP